MRSPLPPLCRQAFAVLAAAFALAACQDDPTSPIIPNGSRSSVSADTGTLGVPDNLRPEERFFAELARQAPSAGGFYYDSTGDMVVLVRDQRHDAAAQQAARAIAASGRLLGPHHGKPGSRVRIARAKYTFRELSRWRDLAFDNALGKIPGVVMLDLDEAHNRVALGINPEVAGSERAEGVARQTLRDLGVPEGALTFARVGHDRLLSAPYSITDQVDEPLPGGLKIVLSHNDNSTATCTLGFPAVRDGVAGFVTASHCTSNMFNPDEDPVYQGTDYWWRRVGTAAVDPDAYTCGFRRCRGADAAFIASSGAIPMGVGLIARTTYTNAGDTNGGSGSTVFDQSNPYWYVTGEENDNLFVGQNVQKVGITTGWTWGWITQTCIDTDGGHWWGIGNSVVRCTYEASFVADGGDSGGPVFVITDQAAGRVTLAGLVTAKDDGFFGSGRARFSKLSRAKSDLGGTWTVQHPFPPPATLAVSVNGPAEVVDGEYNTWDAYVTGGVPPYTYQWSGFASGSGPSVTGSLNHNSDLQVDVWDSQGRHAGAMISVWVRQACPGNMDYC
jgi:hypothetical protein